MSDKWADFDPLSRPRAKPAAPITSLEQAEVRPMKSQPPPRRSEPSSPMTKEATVLSDNNSGASSVHEPGLNEQVESDDARQAPPENPEPREAASDDTAAPVGLSQQSTPGGPELKAEQECVKDPEKQHDKETVQPGPEAELGSSAGAAAAAGSPDAAATSKSSNEEPSTNHSEDAESSKWPAKLELSEPEMEPHHGDLRKNSIAAMKELGSPDARSSGVVTPEEDVPFDFQRFMGLLRSRSADPIARYVKSFLQEFSRGVWSPKQQEKIVSDFQKFIGGKMREFEPFASLGKRDRRNALEGMEKLIMNRLYTRTFPPKMPPILRTDGHNEDLLRDHVFEEKLRLWSWVEGRHLDINEGYLQSGFIQLAANELVRLHQFKSPRDKTICVLNCSKVVWALIRQAQLEQNADSFLPLLIYVVIKAQPAHLVSNLNYIQRFRAKEFQKGEAAYYLSTLASAVTFLDTLDKSSLTISDEEFDQKMEESIAAENQRKEEQQQQQQEQRPQRHQPAEDAADAADLEVHEGESSAAVLAASAGMLVERMRNFTSKFLEDLSTPEETDAEERGQETSDGGNGSPRGNDEAEQRRLVRQARHQYREEEQAAREASREEFRTEQLQRQQFNETSKTLQQMFPGLDSDVVEDVLRQCGTNIGSAVDLCLALVGTS